MVNEQITKVEILRLKKVLENQKLKIDTSAYDFIKYNEGYETYVRYIRQPCKTPKGRDACPEEYRGHAKFSWLAGWNRADYDGVGLKDN